MMLIILGFLFGFSSFFLGLHYSHIKLENKKIIRIIIKQ